MTLAEMGKRRLELLAELEELTAKIEVAAVDAVLAGAPKLYVARDAGVTRPSLDKWLKARRASQG